MLKLPEQNQMDYQYAATTSFNTEEIFHRENQSSRRRSSHRRSSDSNLSNAERRLMKVKRYLSPKICWRETSKLEKIGVCFVLFLFFTGIYVTQTTLAKWAKNPTNSPGRQSSSMPTDDDDGDFYHQNIKIDEVPLSFNCDKELFDVKLQINELLRIKQSVSNELRILEEKRNVIRTEISILLTQSDKLQNELQQGVKDLEKIVSSIEQAKTAHKEAVERNTPEIYAPLKLNQRPEKNIVPSEFQTNVSEKFCTMHDCFDYSRCSFVYGFTVTTVGFEEKIFLQRQHLAPCVVFLNESSNKVLKDDYNQILLQQNKVFQSSFLNTPVEKRIVAGTTFLIQHFRRNFDIVIPPIMSNEQKNAISGNYDEDYWINLPAIVPARRKYLMSFVGRDGEMDNVESKFVLESLRLLLRTNTKDSFHLNFDCSFDRIASTSNVVDGDWTICDDEKRRREILIHSTFSLIIAPEKYVSSQLTQIRFAEALKYGAIPVILGRLTLPFDEMIDWRKAAVVLPKARVSELHFFLRTFADPDILELRRNGRLFWEKYFRNKKIVLNSVLTLVRHRLQMPAEPYEERESETYFNKTFQPTTADAGPQQNLLDADEYLGPVELAYPSPKYPQNFSLVTLHAYETWNVYANPFELHQFNPFRSQMPSEAKFEGSQFGFRPINSGAGGSGKEFSEALGGNFPREQFTVVLLTYEREQVLLAALARLNHLPYLNKIVIVWNGPTPPTPDGIWPKTSAPVVVVKPDKNSLNNRFSYFAEIETEAVLSMDDDVHLRHDEIIFGFRVWREARERIVGFPGRFHGWDSSTRQWVYNSNHSCELSMVLTGAAFVHKYYFHLYSNEMPLAIRNKVDELMNCEDIAMNFLVSHVTKKPPIKVTSRWTFRCPGCPDTLSADESHFNERHECIQFFTQVYGYNPLLYTQFRVDSVLFKTKIPHNHQKCFKFI